MMLITRMHMKCGALLLLAAATSVPNSTTEAFTTPSTSSTRASATVSSRTTLHGFMDAFKNDDSLAPVQNAGISGKVRDCVLVIIYCTIDRCVDASLRTHTLFLSFFLLEIVSFSRLDYPLIILPSSSSWFLVSHRRSIFFPFFSSCSTTTPRRTRTLPTCNVI